MTIMCQGDGVKGPAVNLAIERQGRQLRRKRPGSGGGTRTPDTRIMIPLL